MNDTQSPDPVEQRVRLALSTVAGTVTEEGFATAPRSNVGRKPSRKRRIALGVSALTLIPVGFAAAAVVNQGPEYVDTIAPERIVTTGSVDGSRYLLIETERTDECGQPVTGVELVEEKENLIGSEWNTSGYEYGEYVEKRCDGRLNYVNDTSRYLTDPALFNDSGTMVGDSFLWVYSVHPDVDAVRITSADYTKDLTVYEVDGAGYAPFEIPKDMDEYTSELVIDGQVVPGSTKERQVQRP